MSVLPAGQPLHRVIPDLDDLLYDPTAYLREAPVEIRARQTYGLAALFGVAGVGCLLACAATGEWKDEKLFIGLGLLLAAVVWLSWSLRMRGHALVLQPEGLEVKYRDTTVWCPWALFNAEGTPFVPDTDSPRIGLILPVDSEAVPFVELRRHETCVAHGSQVKGPQFVFTARDEVVLPARYEVRAGDLGGLLLQLGSRLGRQRPRGTPPPEAYSGQEAERPAEPDGNGWITVPLTRLVFPPRCCDCGTATGETMRYYVGARWDWVTGLFVPTRALEVQVPTCLACQDKLRQQTHQGGVRGMIFGSLFALGVSLAYVWQEGLRRVDLIGFLAAVSLAVGALLGFLVGTAASRRPAAELKNYSPSRGFVSARFRNPEYASQILALVRAGEKVKSSEVESDQRSDAIRGPWD
jgi:hypothetical protein